MDFEIDFEEAHDFKVNEKYHTDSRVIDLVKTMKNKAAIEFVSSVVLTFNTSEAFDAGIVEHLTSQMQELSDDVLYDCTHCLESIYNEKNKDELDRYRGAILERYVFEIMKRNRHKNSWVASSVLVFGKGWKSQNSVDAAFWEEIDSSNKKGRSVECTVREKGLLSPNKAAQFQNLQYIYASSAKRMKVSIVCFIQTKAIAAVLGSLADIDFVGRDKFETLIN